MIRVEQFFTEVRKGLDLHTASDDYVVYISALVGVTCVYTLHSHKAYQLISLLRYQYKNDYNKYDDTCPT